MRTYQRGIGTEGGALLMGKNIEVVEKIINGKKYWKVSDALRTIDETDIAYSAGIIDGEGSITGGGYINDCRKGY
jgi:hypothetical protein